MHIYIYDIYIDVCIHIYIYICSKPVLNVRYIYTCVYICVFSYIHIYVHIYREHMTTLTIFVFGKLPKYHYYKHAYTYTCTYICINPYTGLHSHVSSAFL